MEPEWSAGVIVKVTPSTVRVPPIFMPSEGTPLLLRNLAISDIATVFFASETVSPMWSLCP